MADASGLAFFGWPFHPFHGRNPASPQISASAAAHPCDHHSSARAFIVGSGAGAGCTSSSLVTRVVRDRLPWRLSLIPRFHVTTAYIKMWNMPSARIWFVMSRSRSSSPSSYDATEGSGATIYAVEEAAQAHSDDERRGDEAACRGKEWLTQVATASSAAGFRAYLSVWPSAPRGKDRL